MFNLYNLVTSIVVSLFLLISFSSNNIILFWVLLEVSSLFLVYSFINSSVENNVGFCSFIFYLSNGLSSIFIVSGCYFNSSLFVCYGLLCKFFIFPFNYLLLYIFENCSWFLILIIGSLFKGFVITLSYLFSNISYSFDISFIVSLLSSLLILFFYNINLKGLWFILNISSSIVLFIGCINLSNSMLIVLYVFYLLISVISIYCFNFLEFSNNSLLSNNFSLYYVLSVFGFPISINFIYKIIGIVLCFNVFDLYLVFFWCLYLLLETGYLIFYFCKMIENNSIYY